MGIVIGAHPRSVNVILRSPPKCDNREPFRVSKRLMGMRRVEVVVRFAGDLVDVVRVPAGTAYSIGTTSVLAKSGTEVTVGLVTVSMTDATEADAVPLKPV